MERQNRPFRVLLTTPDEAVHRAVRDVLSSEYDLYTASSLAEAGGALERDIDCLVAATEYLDGGAAALLELGEEREVPVVALASTLEPELVRTATRTDDVDVVLRGAGPRAGPGGESRNDAADEVAVAALRDRLEAIYRRSVSDVSDAVLDASRSLMSAAVDEVDAKIEWELGTIGRRLDADRCSFYRYEDERDVFERTHGWASRDDESVERTVPADRFPGFEAKLEQFDAVVIPPPERGGRRDVDAPTSETAVEIPDGFVGDVEGVLGGGDEGRPTGDGSILAADPDDLPPFLSDANLEAFCAVPVVIEWELYGVLAVGRTRSRGWSSDVERQLRVLGELVGHSLRRRGRHEELERQNEQLERFTSVVSHDLQNPLNVITGYAELVLSGADREKLAEVLTAAERMEQLIDDLLALALAGEAVSDTRPVAVGDVAARAWRSIETSDAELRLDVPLVVEADSSRLQQAFENLFKNAVEHGGDDVTVRVREIGGGFAVEDDGSGIPDAHRTEIFREGYTGGNGTGLGLSIVQSVVDAHGWSIEATEGSTGGAGFDISIDE